MNANRINLQDAIQRHKRLSKPTLTKYGTSHKGLTLHEPKSTSRMLKAPCLWQKSPVQGKANRTWWVMSAVPWNGCTYPFELQQACDTRDHIALKRLPANVISCPPSLCLYYASNAILNDTLSVCFSVCMFLPLFVLAFVWN